MQLNQQIEDRSKAQRIKTKSLISDFYDAWEHRSDHPGMLSFADFPEVRIKIFVTNEKEYKDKNVENIVKELADKIRKDNIKLEIFEGQSIRYRVIVEEQAKNFFDDNEKPVRYIDKLTNEIK